VLTLLNISNIALIDELRVEFDRGLNLLTGETGSGKSIIVDSLGALVGGRLTSDLLKSGTDRGFIEGLFLIGRHSEIEALLAEAGIDMAIDSAAPQDESGEAHEIIIRRELSPSGRNKIFINNQLATQSLLRDLRSYLVDIHGQGDQQTLFNTDTHLELLDGFANVSSLRHEVANAYARWHALKLELGKLHQDETEKLQLLDILKFQINELDRAQLTTGEDQRLDDEQRRLTNVEKLTLLCTEAYRLTYEDSGSALARVGQATKQIEELAAFEATFRGYLEGLESARAILEDLAFSLREFSERLEFSPERLAEINDRQADLSRLKRKYGGSIESALNHLAAAQERLRQIEHADERATELAGKLAAARDEYLKQAARLHRERIRNAKKLEQAVEHGLKEVAMESARFQVQVSELSATISRGDAHFPDRNTQGSDVEPPTFNARGIDRVEFYFSANLGEGVKPLAKVASGGEASRLMLVLKTVANASEFPRTIVFDEIDTGIGGRVSEAVGAKLKKLAETNQVLCVTHQPQIARFADSHLLIEKGVAGGRTRVGIEKLGQRGRVEEIARMLTGAEITDSARRHAREMLKG